MLPEARERDPEKAAMSAELVDQLGEMGFFGILVDEAYDGLGLDLKAYAVIAEELSRGWLSVGSIITDGHRPIVPCRVTGASGSMAKATTVASSSASTATSSAPVTSALSV